MTRECLPIIAPRIRLRRFSTHDLRAFQDYRQDPEVGRYQSWSRQSDEDALRFLSAVATDPLFAPGEWNQIAIANADDTVIGDIGICVTEDEQEAELGISMCSAAQGQGLATEAAASAVTLIFANTPVKRVMGITDIRNGPSVRLLLRVGMTEIGRQSIVEDGETIDEIVHEITRSNHAAR